MRHAPHPPPLYAGGFPCRLHQMVSVRAMKAHEDNRNRDTGPSYAYGVLCNNDVEHGPEDGIVCSLLLSAFQPIVSLSHETAPVETPLGGLVQLRETHAHPFRMDTTLIVTDSINSDFWELAYRHASPFSRHEVETYEFFDECIYDRMKEHAEKSTTPRIILMCVDAYTDFLKHNNGMTHESFVFQRVVFDDTLSVDDIDLSVTAHSHFVWFLKHADTCGVFDVPCLPNINVSTLTVSLTNPRPDEKSVEFVDEQDPFSVSCDHRFIRDAASDVPLMRHYIYINKRLVASFYNDIIQVYAASEVRDMATSSLPRDIQYYPTRIDGIEQRVCAPECCITMEPIEVQGTCPFCFTGFEYHALMKHIERDTKCPICRHVLVPKDVLMMCPPRHAIDHHNIIHLIISNLMQMMLEYDDDARIVIFGAFGMRTEWHGRSVSDTVESVVGKSGYTVLQGTHKTKRGRLAAFQETTSRVRVLLMDVNKMPNHVNMRFVTHAIALGDNTTGALMERAIQAFQKKGRTKELILKDIRFV